MPSASAQAATRSGRDPDSEFCAGRLRALLRAGARRRS
jgi:hypothetical protein